MGRQAARQTKATTKKGTSGNLWAVAAGCLAGIAVGLVLTLALAGLLAGGQLPVGTVKILGLVTGCLMAVAAGFCCHKVLHRDGFFFGLLCGAILCAICLMVSLALGESPDWWAAVKGFAMLLCGALGGSFGK